MAFILGKHLTNGRFDIFLTSMVTKGRKKLEEIVTYRQDGGVEVERVVYHIGTKAQCKERMKRIDEAALNFAEEEMGMGDDEEEIDIMNSRERKSKRSGPFEEEEEDDDEQLERGRGKRKKTISFAMRVKQEPEEFPSSDKNMFPSSSLSKRTEPKNTGMNKVFNKKQSQPSPTTRPGFIPILSAASSIHLRPPLVAPTSSAIPSAAEIETKEMLRKIMKKQTEQERMLESIHDLMPSKDLSTYNGPNFLSAERVNELSEFNPVSSAFVRVLLDAVRLEDEPEKRVQERNRMRVRFAYEQFRKLRFPTDKKLSLSEWQRYVSKNNFNLKRRTSSSTYSFPAPEAEEEPSSSSSQ